MGWSGLERNKLDYILTDLLPVEISELFSFSQLYAFLLKKENQKILDALIQEIKQNKAQSSSRMFEHGWSTKPLKYKILKGTDTMREMSVIQPFSALNLFLFIECLVLGDNIFHSDTLREVLCKGAQQQNGATVFGYWVENPRPFGVVEFDEDGRAISIEEKPRHPKSNYIIPGIYFYDNQAMEIVANLTPSQRGELEITDVNLEYLRRDQLQVLPLERDVVWLDAGTADSLMDAGQTIRNIQAETGRYVGCLEELAFNQGWLTEEQVHEAGQELGMTLYGQYLQCL